MPVLLQILFKCHEVIELFLELCLGLVDAEHPRCLEVHLLDLCLVLGVLLDDLLDCSIQLRNDRGIGSLRCENNVEGVDGEIFISYFSVAATRLYDGCPDALPHD